MKLMIPVKAKPVRQAWKKKNASDWPSTYVCNFLEPGLVSYEDVQAGIAMLAGATIDKMLQSMVGKPVLIDHQDVTPATFKKAAVGYVTRVWRDPDGWARCEFMLHEDKAKELVARGYSVSCAYDVLGTGPGGEWHAIKFDEEITDGAFTHLALVTNPRYEECRIFQNSKGAARLKDQAGNEVKNKPEGPAPEGSKQGVKTMLKIRKNINGKVEETEIDPAATYVQIGNAPVLLEAVLNSKPVATEGLEVLDLQGAEIVGEDGTTRTLENAIKDYQKNNGMPEDVKDNARKCSCSKAPKENAKPEDHEEECEMSKKNAKDDDGKENAADDKDDKGDKKNGKAPVRDIRFFTQLNSVRENAAERTITSAGPQVDTRFDRVNRGNSRYGTKKKEAAAA